MKLNCFYKNKILIGTCISCFLMLVGHIAYAQPLQADVTVSVPKLQEADPRIFNNLEQDIRDFMNDQPWSTDEFYQEEKIQCNIAFTITEERGDNSFRATLALQATRPVFGSAYESPILTWQDRDVIFEYEPNKPLIFSKNTFNDNLTSVLAFYANIIVGLDYDSFSLLGGEPYFQSAQDIINTLPPNLVNQPGWDPSGNLNRSRYALLDNLLSARVKPLRQAYYQYHRHGLDVMHEDPAKGRATMMQCIDQLNQVNRNVPNSAIVNAFLSTKSQEIVDVFLVAEQTQKLKIFQILTAIDPSNTQRFSPLRF